MALDQAKYTAVNASSCDHFVYPELKHNRPYQFNITHKNISGEPFFVCIESHDSKQCEVFKYLPSGNNWMTTSLFVPRLKEDETGYTLHLYNYSIGHTPTENAWSQIAVSPAEETTITYASPDLPYAQIITARHLNPAMYQVELTPASSATTVVLNQAFDPGWKAYSVNKALFDLPLLTALSTQALPENNHYQFYGWANGWILPQGSRYIIFFYTPQILQWLGFALLALTPILIFSHPLKKAPEEGR